ncbi:gamma-glutamylcyclotransferase family protein, partial [Ruminococcus sp.]|uniref:gamma-glutamylcyclotransferase family protein n=1 Tax=Ruminococcus sp. TaxID=41978 RepID=UPI003AB5051D
TGLTEESAPPTVGCLRQFEESSTMIISFSLHNSCSNKMCQVILTKPKVIGTSEIKDFELEFRGVATIVPNKGASVPVLIWELDERDLPNLNRYEGYPRFYRQENMSFELNGKVCTGMAYLINYGELSPPSSRYYNTILQGYKENSLDESYLITALENSLFIEHSVNDEFDEDYDLDDDMQMKF